MVITVTASPEDAVFEGAGYVADFGQLGEIAQRDVAGGKRQPVGLCQRGNQSGGDRGAGGEEEEEYQEYKESPARRPV